ncbi:hypothetical protein [Chryseobacterium sp. ON_d1]|uniref:hypothetical protein n=1 Tax=Chryseobacterium sp. ON_d1 TaxID=2583211 RepID=UPI00115985DC|nr:hypothetical protein [Chryseobacterium sp. ON_d1]GEJ46036.1 hypothetical protein CRS_26440 [Chryseobacterium sp. ON_d1]
MKSLELSLNKRLLIVEYDHEKFLRPADVMQELNMWDLKLICKGPDLTEDIAKGLVERKKAYDTPEIYFFKNYKNEFLDCLTALQAFISSIEASGYHWGENPYEKELDRCNAYTDMFTIAKRARKYAEAESRTFNPSKCIIFEIV